MIMSRKGGKGGGWAFWSLGLL